MDSYQLYLERQKSALEAEICAIIPQNDYEKIQEKCAKFSRSCPIPAEAYIEALSVAKSLLAIGFGADRVAGDLTSLINMMEEERSVCLRFLSADVWPCVDFAGDAIRNIGAEDSGKETDRRVQRTKGRKSYNPRLTKAVLSCGKAKQGRVRSFGMPRRRVNRRRVQRKRYA